jgi:two-component sensor histidine kinase
VTTAVEGPQDAPAALVPTANRKRWQPATLLILVSFGLLVVVFAIFGFLVWQAYYLTLSQAEQKARAGAQVIAQAVPPIIDASLEFLARVDLELGAESTLVAELDRFQSRLSTMFEGSSFGLYDATGRLIKDEGSGLPPTLEELEPLPHFADAGWSLTTVHLEPQGSALAVVRRLPSSSGIGVVVLRPDLLEVLRAPLALGAGSTASLVRDDGVVLVRDPPLSEPLTLAGSPVFQTLTSTPTGSYASPTSPVDGVARIVGFAGVPRSGIIALASVSQSTVLAGLWSATITVLWLMGPIALALIVGSLLTARVLRHNTETQARLASALDHNETLLSEIHHRVKNNLQSVAALIQLQAIPRDLKVDIGQRITAMAAVHEHIYKSGQFHSVDAKHYLTSLLENLKLGLKPNVVVSYQLVEGLDLDKDVAGHLGLLLNEAMSNASKHAFPDDRPGQVRVHLDVVGEDRARLTVEDNGVGFDPGAAGSGVGRRLMMGLATQIDGELSFSSAPGRSVVGVVFATRRPA